MPSKNCLIELIQINVTKNKSLAPHQYCNVYLYLNKIKMHFFLEFRKKKKKVMPK